MNFFDHKGLGGHLLQLCPKVVKHPVYENDVAVGFLGWTVKSKDGILAHIHLGEYYVFCNVMLCNVEHEYEHLR
jgi:hypothetical protein